MQASSPIPWIVAFVEGFSTLAVEVIAIRLAVPVVGSSITLTGVMLGVVLFALSAGYWRGGALSARWDRSTTRSALARNLLIAAVLYGALAFPFEAALLEKALDSGLSLPVAIGASAALLFVLPIYLASQTVPMLAQMIDTEGKAGKASGRVLFFSTIGSVAGGIATPVWLFPNLGVARSTYVVCALLGCAAFAMGAGRMTAWKAAAAGVAAVVLIAGSNALARQSGALFSFESAYQSIRIVKETGDEGRPQRVLTMGGGRASGVFADTAETSFEYVRLAGHMMAASRPATVLVIGAAGFTFPRDAALLDGVERVDAVDVDPVVKDIAERHFLMRPLPAKVRFLPLSARYAVRRMGQRRMRYGFTFIDAYAGKGIPEELATVEFFRDVAAVSGRAAANIVMDPELETAFARNLLATFREAFGRVWVKRAKAGDSAVTNLLVTNWAAEASEEWLGKGAVYRDDRNTADPDRIRMLWNGE